MQIGKLGDTIATLNKESQENMSTIDEQADVIDGLSKERDVLSFQIAKCSEDMDALQKRLSEVTVQKNACDLLIDSLRLDMEAEQFTRQQMEGQHEVVVAEMRVLKERNETLLNEYEGMANEKNRLSDEVRVSSKKVKGLFRRPEQLRK